ncbi:hypothetical protein BOTBODRAFT_150803 [Botryobasidium botryosum FD-172 SS1]|uniref:Cyclin-domain-containing protein n=1 Tax=Botryobasidium botryosum (strain FD-172 SS1) TaxID=930990 RepID=A0A067N1Y1_BOTB1|nr:hypothetical protein BOTBODRAFT_150803 [Botryobasidium botryosum FD-172 SS1]
MDHLVVMIADMLERLLSFNDQIPLSPEGLTRFHSRTPPTISVLEYLRRIVKYTNVERSCLLITLHYIDRICERLKHFTISSLTVHRFIISSVTVSTKALCDAFCTNSHYAKVGGIQLIELNILEKEFLNAIDWRLSCTGELLQSYYVNLVRSHSTGVFKIADPDPSAATNEASGEADEEYEYACDVDADGDAEADTDAYTTGVDDSITAGSESLTSAPSTPVEESDNEVLIPDGTTVMDTASASSESYGVKVGDNREVDGGPGGGHGEVGYEGMPISEDVNVSPATVTSPTRGSKRRGVLFEIVDTLRPRGRRRIDSHPV